MINRRSFVQRLIGGAVALAVAPSVVAASRKRFDYPQVPLPSRVTRADGCVYEYAQATRELLPGDCLLNGDGRIVGVAVKRIAKDHYGWVQCSGLTWMKVGGV